MIMVVDNGEAYSDHAIYFIYIGNLDIKDCETLVKMCRYPSGEDFVIGIFEEVKWYSKEQIDLVDRYDYFFHDKVNYDILQKDTVSHLLGGWIAQVVNVIDTLEDKLQRNLSKRPADFKGDIDEYSTKVKASINKHKVILGMLRVLVKTHCNEIFVNDLDNVVKRYCSELFE